MIIILQEFLNVGYLIQNFSAQPDIRNDTVQNFV